MRKKYIPSQRDLDRAWVWKKRKKTSKEICKKIGISPSQWELSRSIFNSYFGQQKKLEKHKEQVKRHTHRDTVNDIQLKKKKNRSYKRGESKLEITDIDLDQLKAFVVCGFTRERIADLLGITRSTLQTYSKAFPHIKDVLDNEMDRATSGVVKSMLKMTDDRMVDDTVYASYLGEIFTDKIKKHVPANGNMVKYWMANKAGWSTEPKPLKSNNKGLIIKMLDDMANHDDDVGPVDD